VILVVGIIPAKRKAMNHDIIYSVSEDAERDTTDNPNTERYR
jgi:hypothetical protein